MMMKIFITFICHPASLIDSNNVGKIIKVLKGLLGLMSLQNYTNVNARDEDNVDADSGQENAADAKPGDDDEETESLRMLELFRNNDFCFSLFIISY